MYYTAALLLFLSGFALCHPVAVTNGLEDSSPSESLLIERSVHFVPNDLLVAELKSVMIDASKLLSDLNDKIDQSPTDFHPLTRRLAYNYDSQYERIDWISDVAFKENLMEELDLNHPTMLLIQYFSAALMERQDLCNVLEPHMYTVTLCIIQQDVTLLRQYIPESAIV